MKSMNRLAWLPGVLLFAAVPSPAQPGQAVHAATNGASAPAIPASTMVTINPLTGWEPWKSLGLDISYFSVQRLAPDRIQLWMDAHMRSQGLSGVACLEGQDLASMGRPPPLFTASIATYDRDLDGIPHPIITRTSAVVLKDGTPIVFAAVGPRYRGTSELYPALFTRAADGQWKHLGPPAGEPATWLAAARRTGAPFRCEGGSIVELPDGRLRMYAHGYCEPSEVEERGRSGRLIMDSVFIAEAVSVEGPWTFLRGTAGKCINIIGAWRGGARWLFPHVAQIGTHGYMLTGGDQWPPKGILAAFSRDGIHFTRHTDSKGKPAFIITPRDVDPGSDSCKVLRGAFDPSTGMFEAAMNVHPADNSGNFIIYHSRATFDLRVFDRLPDAPTKPGPHSHK